MQERITLPTSDGHTIYGTWDSASESERKSDSYSLRDTRRSLIIFVHGLTGNMYEHHYFNAVPFFTSRGFDTFRFNHYSAHDEARQLSECSISIHTEDLTTVINFFMDQYQYEHMFLVGHSLGAPVILNTDLHSIKKIVLWDPTRGMKNLEEKGCYYHKGLGNYVLEWGLDILLSQEMINDWKKAADIPSQIKKIIKPCKLIFAQKCDIHEHWQPFLKDIKVPYESVVIPGATHGFNQEGVEERLFQETLAWL
jgi:pimeloyl-ACP methyl ester carboxylesterase